MLGHLMEWFYDGLGGIGQTDSSVGFHTIRIAPEPEGNITSARDSFMCPYGRIVSNWEKKGATFSLSVDIPANASALIGIPVKPGQEVYEGTKKIEATAGGKVSYRDGRAWTRTGSGKYVFTAK
jgi:hypothetical protein